MDLDSGLSGTDPSLATLLKCIASAVGEISSILRTAGSAESGSLNTFGDKQLQVDMQVDDLIWTRLRQSGCVEVGSSEEQPEMVPLGGSGYSVAFDPLDGSSIFGANFAVGSIFGVWPGSKILGQCGRDQVAALYAVYGPRTLLVLAWRTEGQGQGLPLVHEYVLAEPRTSPPTTTAVTPTAAVTAAAPPTTPAAATASPAATAAVAAAAVAASAGSKWHLLRSAVTLGASCRVFAPANLRCASQNAAYHALVGSWMAEGYTLRYSGGMVPDVHHILAKAGGVFCSPASASSPAKLRLAYECAPLAFVMEAVGGTALGSGGQPLLDQVIESASERSVIALGSRDLVQQCAAALAASST